MQPVPVFDTKQTGDVLLSVGAQLGFSPGPATFLEFLRGRWVEMHRASGSGMSFDDFWQTTLRAGFAEMAVSAAESPGAALQSPDAALTFDPPNFDGDAADFVLLVHPSSRFGDGEHSNLPWLQELPDPVSKITWHSWLEMHPDAAESRGLRSGDVVHVASPHGEVEVPLWLYPGIREDTVALAMGGGHVGYGRHADGMGVNAMHLLPTRVEQPSGTVITLATRVSVTATGARRQLASVDGSTSQSGRPIAPAVALASLTAGPGEGAVTAAVEGTEGEAAEHGELQQLQAMGGFVPVPNEGTPEGFPPAGIDSGEYALAHEGPRWAMTIDLDKCTGCSACVVACQSENNVPWVGEQQILMGRELHWIRLERYYEHIDAHEAAPLDIRHLPMLCQHCGNAPCEPVCPVFAAYHTPDGLNAQIYNRCVGTRYCANNCPYKVRVFNWFTYSDVPEPMNWAFNPDVTVREGGVMEKCSFCVQRIREGENLARLEDRELETDEISPACQQVCPAEAIVFGNIRDSEAEVATTTHNERAYRVLDELINTQPAVTYLKKVTFHEVDSAEHG